MANLVTLTVDIDSLIRNEKAEWCDATVSGKLIMRMSDCTKQNKRFGVEFNLTISFFWTEVAEGGQRGQEPIL
jgi:hypothetical protein